MDAQTLATAAGVPLGTLNMWVTRGFIPGERLGRGRRREFDLEVAIRVGIVAEPPWEGAEKARSCSCSLAFR